MTKKISLALMLALIISMLVPITAMATSVVVDSDILEETNMGYPNTRTSFITDDGHWKFFQEGTALYSVFSSDGISWGTPINTTMLVINSVRSNSFSCCWDGIHVHLTAYAAGGNRYRMGTPLGNGTITWIGTEDVTPGGNYPYIQTDSNGYPWIVIYGISNSHGMVYKSSTKDGTWTTDVAVTKDLGGSVTDNILLSLGSGRMAVVYGSCYGGCKTVKLNTWTGSAWRSEVSTSSINQGVGNYPYLKSAVSIGSIVHLIFLESVSYDLIYTKYDYANDFFGGETVIASALDATSGVVIGKIEDYGLAISWIKGNDIYEVFSWNNGLSWSSPLSNTGDTLPTAHSHLSLPENAEIMPGDISPVYYVTSAHTMKVWLGNITTGAPVGVMLEATDITAYSATLNAKCIWAGGSTCYAYLMYGSPTQDGNISVGEVTSGLQFDTSATGLVPDQTYGCWCVFVNDTGEFWTTPVVYFNTLDSAEVAVPIVETQPCNPVQDVGTTSARLYGNLVYDGNLECFVGFEYRVQGVSTWTQGWNSEKYHTGQAIRGTLTNLQLHTTYEFRAIAKNAMNLPDDWENGLTLTFTTGYISGATPTPAGSGGIDWGGFLPDSTINWITGLSSGVKMVLALVITIGGMCVIAFGLPTAKAAGTIVVAYGIFATLLFIVIGWYPIWITVLLSAIVGLGLLFLLLSSRK